MKSAGNVMQDVLAKLRELGIAFELHKHAPVMNVVELKKEAGSLSGNLAKNLFIKDKNKKKFLIVAGADKEISLKSVGKLIGAKGDVRFADQVELESTLRVPQGHVSPLACFHDTKHEVDVFVEKDLAESKSPMLVHPCSNDHSVGILFADLVKFLEAIGSRVQVLDVGGGSTTPAAAVAPAAVTKATPDAPKPKETKPKEAKEPKEAKAAKPKDTTKDAAKDKSRSAQLGLECTKEENFSKW